MIIWSAQPVRGPKAPPGEYQVRFRAGDYEKTYPLSVEMNPNLKGITQEDLEEQFKLASQIRDQTSRANEAVIMIREMRSAIEDRLSSVEDASVTEMANKVVNPMTAIEEDLYQVKNRSNQDPLNFPIKLNNRFAYLRRSLERGDARPTDGAYQVFKELSRELDDHLTKLAGVLDSELPKFNAMLTAKGMAPVERAKKKK
jgi:hypothetical protein